MNLHQDFFNQVRSYSIELCKPLFIEDYIPQPEEFVSPPKWHLAHTTWFFEEFILKNQPGYKVFNEKYAFLFNSYYNHIGTRTVRGKRGDMTRPTVEEVYKYREYVNQHMLSLLGEEADSEVAKLLVLGLNHEQQHQELLITDLKYTLSLNPLDPVYKSGFSLVDDIGTESGQVKISSGNYTVGVNTGEKGFFFDNEHNQHQVYIESFSIAKKLVSNGDFLEFINAGGYNEFKFWHDEGYAWAKEYNASQPLYWRQQEGRWFQFTLAGLNELKMDAPLAHINFYEASAYAAWKGERLPTEAEWEVASDLFKWGNRWEWTQSAYLPYPGYKIAEGALGEYNGKFMVNQKVLRGASRATSPGHSRKSYRNFFHPHHRWQLTGIRLVK